MVEVALFAQDLDDQPLVPPPVELAIEDRLPGTEIEPPARYGQDDLMVDEQVLEVRVAVVLAPAVVAVVAGIRTQGRGHVVGGGLPPRSCGLVPPLESNRLDPPVIFVDPDA